MNKKPLELLDLNNWRNSFESFLLKSREEEFKLDALRVRYVTFSSKDVHRIRPTQECLVQLATLFELELNLAPFRNILKSYNLTDAQFLAYLTKVKTQLKAKLNELKVTDTPEGWGRFKIQSTYTFNRRI